MALYSYEAFSKDGKKIRGAIDSASVTGAREQLAAQGLYVISIAAGQKKAGFLSRIFSRGLSVKEKILFTKQFAILLKSGVPLLQALELLIEQFEGTLRSALVAIKDDVKEGISLADAMAKYPRLFDNIYVQLVRAGEASGKLELILDRLTHYLERQDEIARKIKGALQQPIMQLIVAVVVVIALLTFVVPELSGVFVSLGQALPWQTRFLMATSDFILNYYIVLGIILIVSIGGFLYWKRTASGKYMMDKIKLHIPMIKYITKTNAVVQFSYTLGMLLEGGVNLSEALDIVVKIIDNQVLASSLKVAKDKIVQQGKITEYLKQTGIFPPIALYLLQTGEQSGQLDTMLITVAQNYEEDLNELVDKLTGLIGPIMLVVMGLIVGFIIMSVMGPIMQAGQGQIEGL